MQSPKCHAAAISIGATANPSIGRIDTGRARETIIANCAHDWIAGDVANTFDEWLLVRQTVGAGYTTDAVARDKWSGRYDPIGGFSEAANRLRRLTSKPSTGCRSVPLHSCVSKRRVCNSNPQAVASSRTYSGWCM